MVVDFVNVFGANLLLTLILLAISAIPLYFAVKFMGGNVSFLETMVVILISGGIPIVLGIFFNNYIKMLSFLCIILVYMFFFKLSIWRAIIAWFVQYVIIFALLLLLSGAALGFLAFG